MNRILILVLPVLLSACAVKLLPNANLVEAANINTRLGYAYFQEGQLNRAKEKFQLALEQNPKLVGAYVGLAFCYEKTGDEQLVNHYYQQALRLKPNDPALNNNYGVFLCQQKQYQSSLSYLLKAAKTAGYIHAKAAARNAKLCAARRLLPRRRNW